MQLSFSLFLSLRCSDPVFGGGTRAAYAIYKNGTRVKWIRGAELRQWMVEKKDTRFIDQVEAERLERKVIEAMKMAAGHVELLTIEDIRERKEEEAKAEEERKAREELKKRDFSGAMKVHKPKARKETDNEVKNALKHADEAMAELAELSRPSAEQKRLRRRQALMKLYQDSEERNNFTMKGLAADMGMSGKQFQKAALSIPRPK
jgi:hydroxylamine reductase (hybrid-cluster protein)